MERLLTYLPFTAATRHMADRVFRFSLSAAILLAIVILGGCANVERHADAAFVGYRISLEAGADLIASPEVDDTTKAKVQAAAKTAKPYGDALFAALATVKAGSADVSDLQRALLAAIPALTAFAIATGTHAPSGAQSPETPARSTP